MAAPIPAGGKRGSQLAGVEYPTPAGTEAVQCFVVAVQIGNLLFLSGSLPIESQKPKFVGRIGKELGGACADRAPHNCSRLKARRSASDLSPINTGRVAA